jgi:hypothetical protein|uniref:Sec-independent periplasmic protein translocase n=1 Tax=Ochromonas sp. CCMP1393 TaxID=420556 RepID=A0A0D3ML23_9STRA|nr:Sec-independent periplasmic protein translocase [Ochromonas sp. CCMP1393]
MLNLDETLSFQENYESQRDYYLRIFLYSISVIVFIDIVRSQVSEINLLQLIPGFYLLLIFGSLFFLTLTSDFLFGFPTGKDTKKDGGTKTTNKLELIVILRFCFFFLYTTLFISLNSILPLSLDSFNFYTEDSLENVWSFDEVIGLENILLLILIFLSQSPVFLVGYFTTEKIINRLPEFWRLVVLLSIVFAGIVTPTVDGFTQFGIAFISITLYLTIINIIEKRVSIKFIGFNAIFA